MMIREWLYNARNRSADTGERPRPKNVRELRSGVPVVGSGVTIETAQSLSAVYRAISLIVNSISQLPLYSESGGTRVTGANEPAIIRQPNLHMSRGEFVSCIVRSLVLYGNAFWLAEGEHRGSAANLIPIHPAAISVDLDKNGVKIYSLNSKKYTRDQIGHIALNQLPGELLGKGPLQLAAPDIASALATRDHTAKYFSGDGQQPGGLLSTDDDLTADEVEEWKAAWNGYDLETETYTPTTYNPARVKVLGRGLKYQPLYPDPKSAQWIEARTFDTTTIARLFGIPSTLLLAALEGSSKTYANVEQEWIALARFCLTEYTQRIEDELTRFTPHGHRVKFNFEGLLRPDTTTRYQAHALALQNGFLTIDEVRKIEGLPPLHPTTSPEYNDGK